MKRTVLLTLLLGIAVIVAGCGGGKKAATTPTTTPAPVTSGQAALEMKDFSFSPMILKGKPGQKVTVELKNTGTVEHNFTVASQGINKDVEAGETATVDVTIPQSGTVAFYCKYHKARGMTGQLQAGSGVSSSGGSTSTGYTSTGY